MPQRQHASRSHGPPKPASRNASSHRRPLVPRTSRSPGARTTAQSVLKALELMVLAAVYSSISQLCLSPVYGSIPASLHHPRLVMAAILLGWISKSSLQRYLPRSIGNYLPLHAFVIPAIQFYLFEYSGALGPVYGPLLTELLTYFPLAALSVYAAAVELEVLDLSQYGERMQNSGPAVVSYFVFTATEKLSTEFIGRNMGSSFVFTRGGLQLAVATFYALIFPSKVLVLAVLPILHFASMNVHAPLERTTQVLNATLHSYNYSLVARQESLTGYISVLDSMKDGFRVMRCDHSLLGGEWVPPPGYAARVKDPIYSVFAILEAVRLVETPSSKGTPDDQSNALVIGLGVGTTPSALIARGVQTTTVEIDPVVVDFATRYFSLPTNHTSVIEDAVTFVSHAQALGPNHPRYNYIIHDVFTGGAEPVSLFTQEFIQGLSDLLKPEGVMAINYAGDALLPSTALVINTITSVFPSCRLFRESPPPPSQPPTPPNKDFTNLILFCRKSPAPFSFRTPSEEDFLGSNARRENLLPRYEISLESFGAGRGAEVLRKGRMGGLEVGQRESAVGHWEVMRGVLPGAVWENW